MVHICLSSVSESSQIGELGVECCDTSSITCLRLTQQKENTVGNQVWCLFYNEEERKFTPIQITPAILERQYEVVTLSDTNGYPMISKNPVEPVRSDLIVLKNNTSNPVQTLNLGFVMDNNIASSR